MLTENPVTFPPGRARVAAQPSATGSVPPTATTGVDVVAFIAAALGFGTSGNQDIDTQLDQLDRERFDAIVTSLGGPPLDGHIAALDVTEIAQTAWEGILYTRVPCQHEEPDARHLPRLLRLGGERRGEEAARDRTEEFPPVRSLDHLVRAEQERRRDREAESLRGLEVDHQLERRGLFDGKSAGFAPRTMRSTYVAAR